MTIFSTPFSLDLVLTLMIADVMAAVYLAWWRQDRFYYPTVITALLTAVLTAVCAVAQPSGIWFYLLVCYAILFALMLTFGWTWHLRQDARRNDPRRR